MREQRPNGVGMPDQLVEGGAAGLVKLSGELRVDVEQGAQGVEVTRCDRCEERVEVWRPLPIDFGLERSPAREAILACEPEVGSRELCGGIGLPKLAEAFLGELFQEVERRALGETRRRRCHRPFFHDCPASASLGLEVRSLASVTRRVGSTLYADRGPPVPACLNVSARWRIPATPRALFRHDRDRTPPLRHRATAVFRTAIVFAPLLGAVSEPDIVRRSTGRRSSANRANRPSGAGVHRLQTHRSTPAGRESSKSTSRWPCGT